MLAVAVRGHPGWNHRNREATAAFSLAVTLEAMDRDVPVYIPIRQAIEIRAAEIRVPIEV